jgi:hypothetical protein
MDGTSQKRRHTGDRSQLETNCNSLNGDGKADILWYNPTTGQTAIWLMNGPSITANASLLTDPGGAATLPFSTAVASRYCLYCTANGQTFVVLMNALRFQALVDHGPEVENHSHGRP